MSTNKQVSTQVIVSVLTVFPELYGPFFTTSLVARAQKKGLIHFQCFRFSDFCQPTERIDEPTCGPGPGMVIKPEVIERAIEHVEGAHGSGIKIFFSPQGEKLTQKFLQKFTQDTILTSDACASPDTKPTNHILLVCARYEGIDERCERFYADHLLSIGDYVLMGADLPAQVFIEGFMRLIPGVVGKEESVQSESFSSHFLDYPLFGKPLEWKGMKVPDVVTSGNHAEIETWRRSESCKKTLLKRFDFLVQQDLSDEEKKYVYDHIPSHYMAIMHTDVLVKGNKVGTTSVSSIDIHDSARTAATYGIKKSFLVTPLSDQQEIVRTFLDFWHSEEGKKYNYNRYEAVSRIVCLSVYDEMIAYIEHEEGKKPLVIATSAQCHDHSHIIDYFSQGDVWHHERPVLFLFGTGQGLSDERINSSDYLLDPLYGFPTYNHLSVRAALAITLDRWLGLRKKYE